MKKILFAIPFLLGIWLMPSLAMAQGNIDESLASEYYAKGEFDKAAMLYKKLVDRDPNSVIFYDAYLTCLLNLKDYPTAEKEIKKLVRRNSDDLTKRVDLGYVYGLEGQDKQSRSVYEGLLDDLSPDLNNITSTATAFMRRDLTDYAIKTYEKGRKLIKDETAFITELGALYKSQGDYEKMFGEYMRLLDANPYEFDNVKDYLQETVMQDAPYNLFKKILLKRTQEQPDNVAYSELLTWLFVQRRDFTSAFIQDKSIDRRLKEGGRRLIDLARIVTDYNDYEMAQKIYRYVLDQGPEAMYYIPAERGMLDISYIKITHDANYTADDVQGLIKAYNDFLNRYGMVRAESGEVVLRLAEIEAQYNGQVKEAIQLLTQFIGLSGIDKTLIGRAKIALGDYNLLDEDPWEATLFYSQVEKMFKDDELGHEAKFRNAKLSFYLGDFDWAKAQLDVLKSSTSELIANDAMQLSLLIQDNLGLDTTSKPLKLFAEADFYAFKNMFVQANKKLDSLTLIYPVHSLSDDVLMLRATMASRQHDYTKALEYYEKVYTQYGSDILGDDALYRAAELYDKYLNQPDKAKELYEKLILNYQGSVYAVDARTRYRILRGDTVQ